MARRKKEKEVEAYKHSTSRRVKIPTDESVPYMPEEEQAPEGYRSPTQEGRSEPVLSWEREINLENLEIQAHPLYIHEKVSPASFVQSLVSVPAGAGGESGAMGQDALWDDFNGFPEGSTYEWYRHTGNWQNRIVRGDSSRIMASLLAKEGMAGKVQMIYFDPPYGISFKSNFQANTRSRDVKATAADIPNEPGVVSCFRDTYERGIHSYLDNILKNVGLARDLLADSGSLFLQMGPDNAHRLCVLLDEVFGTENRVAVIPFVKSGGTSAKTLPMVNDYLLWYAKDKEQMKYTQLYEILSREEKLEHMSSYAAVEMADGTCRSLTAEERGNLSLLPVGSRLYRRMGLTSMHESTSGRSDSYVWKEKKYECPPNRQWSVSSEGLDRLAEIGRLDVAETSNLLHWKRYEEEVPGRRVTNLWSRLMSADDLHYVVETAESVIERCLLMSTDPGDLVLDITCGSGTTAYVAEKWGRRWITTDTSGVAVSLTRQRIASGVFDYYLLLDSPEGVKKEAALSRAPLPPPPIRARCRKGFCVRESPHRQCRNTRIRPTDQPDLLGELPLQAG